MSIPLLNFTGGCVGCRYSFFASHSYGPNKNFRGKTYNFVRDFSRNFEDLHILNSHTGIESQNLEYQKEARIDRLRCSYFVFNFNSREQGANNIQKKTRHNGPTVTPKKKGRDDDQFLEKRLL